jgi:hypothetical protein
MDRVIVYPGAIPQDTDVLSTNQFAMIALGFLAQATVGTGTVVDGLVCTPTSPATLTVNVGPGSIFSNQQLEPSAYGSISQDTTDNLVKIGINYAGSTSFTLTAPGTSGQSINYLIEATYAETDTNPVALPYYNATNPSIPYSGPDNSGVPQNTLRLQRVSLQLKAGASAGTGTQTTPSVDSGWVGLYVITVNYGQTQIVSGGITIYPGAPFIWNKLGAPSIPVPYINATAGLWSATIPTGATRAKLTLVGGGGGGAGTGGTYNAGGGGAGATGIKWLSGLVSGQAITGTIGAGGTGGTTANGGNGGTTNAIVNGVGTIYSAGGGLGGITSSVSVAGGGGGTATNCDLNLTGGFGNDGDITNVASPSGIGAPGFMGMGGGRAASGGGSPANAMAPGAGGGGSYNIASTGGNGAAGMVMIEWMS